MKQKSIKIDLICKIMLVITLFTVFSNCTPKPYASSELNGKSESILIENLGVPKYNIEFILNKHDLLEYQLGLLTFYPEPDGKNINIKQIEWEKRQRKTIVWLHKINSQWISFDNLSWNPNKIKF